MGADARQAATRQPPNLSSFFACLQNGPIWAVRTTGAADNWCLEGQRKVVVRQLMFCGAPHGLTCPGSSPAAAPPALCGPACRWARRVTLVENIGTGTRRLRWEHALHHPAGASYQCTPASATRLPSRDRRFATMVAQHACSMAAGTNATRAASHPAARTCGMGLDSYTASTACRRRSVNSPRSPTKVMVVRSAPWLVGK